MLHVYCNWIIINSPIIKLRATKSNIAREEAPDLPSVLRLWPETTIIKPALFVETYPGSSAGYQWSFLQSTAIFLCMTSTIPSTTLLRDLYTRMLTTRIVDEYARRLSLTNSTHLGASCRGYEAAQVGSASCIEVGTDFTLPHARDLGVMLTIGMTPYEVFRSQLQTQQRQRWQDGYQERNPAQFVRHWSYYKHNTVSDPTSAATQLLHAAGIAFASKLRQAAVVTVAYCDDTAVAGTDFLESVTFATSHRLPIIYICEQDCTPSALDMGTRPSCTQGIPLPAGLAHVRIDGADVLAVHEATRSAIEHARAGHGPTLLELSITRSLLPFQLQQAEGNDMRPLREMIMRQDPLIRYRQYLQAQGAWDDEWAVQLAARVSAEIERAMQNAIRDTLQFK